MNKIFMSLHSTPDDIDRAFFDGEIKEEERYIWRSGYNAGWGHRVLERRGVPAPAIAVMLLLTGLALGLLAQWAQVLLP